MRNPFSYELTSFHEEVTGVTGSCHLLEIPFSDGYVVKLLIDCGISFHDTIGANPKLDFDPKEIDAILITHAHQDHIGLLPYLYKRGFRGYIFTASPNVHKSLISISLLDTASILENHKKKDKEILYSLQDVRETCDRLVPIEYNIPSQLIHAGKNHQKIRRIFVTLLKNGHLPGAAIIEILISFEGIKRKIIFTGDYKKRNFYLNAAENIFSHSKKAIPTDVIIESTYGNKTIAAERVADEFIARNINSKNSVMISSFANLRMQQVLYTVKKLKVENKISKNTPIYIHSSLGDEYTKTYLNYGYLNKPFDNFMPSEIKNVKTEEAKNDLFNKIGIEPFILITSGPDGMTGTSSFYLKRFLSCKNTAVLFTSSYLFGSKRLEEIKEKSQDQTSDKLLTSFFEPIHLNADVCFTGEYSLHALQSEIIHELTKVPHLKNVFINHGNNEVKEELAKVLKHTFPAKVKIFVEDRNKTFKVTSKDVTETLYFYEENEVEVNKKDEKKEKTVKRKKAARNRRNFKKRNYKRR